MTINEIENEIIEEFEEFEDWLEKYEFLIELSNDLPVIADQYKQKGNLIEGCQSRVWLHAEMNDAGKVQFTADSDAIITRGIIALLIRVMNKQTPAEIKNCKLQFIDKIGLSQNLSPTRSNGLLAMIKQMKMYALAFEQLNKNK